MTRLQFDHLVESLELRFKGRPTSLIRNVLGWALLGYFVLIAALFSSFGMVVGCLWAVCAAPGFLTIKIGLILGVGAFVIGWSILRGAWIRLSPPKGEILTDSAVPRLFEMIDATAAQVGGVHFHRVLLTEELNASVVQIPLLGIFGLHRNYLTLGMSLLDALPPDEFNAVLAHEFAHLSKAHGRTGNWLYRIRSSWENVATSLSQQRGLLVRPLASFFGWFWPRFNARAFVLSRANEFEADAFSAAATSPATAGRALQRIAIESRRLHEEFWGTLNQRASRESLPPAAIYQDLSALLKSPVGTANSLHWLSQHMAIPTGTADTHPGLQERLSALGISSESSSFSVVAVSAADDLLGQVFSTAARHRFSEIWTDANREAWLRAYQLGNSNRQELHNLTTAPLTEENLWKHLNLRGTLDGVASICSELENWVAAHPDHLASLSLLGTHWLSLDNPAGIPLLEKVMKYNPLATYECLGAIMNFHNLRGDANALKELKQRADQHDEQVERAITERNNLRMTDTFESHGISDDRIAEYCNVFAKHPEIYHVSLVRKNTIELPLWPHYVMIVRLKFPALKVITDSVTSSLLQTLANEIEIDGYLFVISQHPSNKDTTNKIKSIPDATLYEV